MLNDELLSEFPFAKQLDRSIALSMFLTAAARGGVRLLSDVSQHRTRVRAPARVILSNWSVSS